MTRGAGLGNSAPVFEGKSFPGSLAGSLRCPCCGSRFSIGFELRSSQEGLRDGVLRCDCYEYPVVSGIAVLRQINPVSSTRNEAVEFLKRQDPDGALRWLFENGSAKGVPGPDAISPRASDTERILRRLRKLFRKEIFSPRNPFLPPREGFLATLQATRPRGYAEYLFHRFANPSLLGAVPPLLVLCDACRMKSPGRVLDLLCGVGHACAILGTLRPEAEIVAVDGDFVNLYLARNIVAPQGAAICIDAELPLPFADSSFDGLFCLDGLHYIRSKVALLREVDRVVNPDGYWVFAHMHNIDWENENPGAPLSADAYAERFAFGRNRLMAESEVLRQFQESGSLDLTAQSEGRSLASSHALTLVGARTETLWRKHTSLDDAFCRRPDLLGFNPLYRVEEIPEGLMLRSEWPSDSLRRECVGKTPVLPESVVVPRAVIREIVESRKTGSLSDDVRKLLRSYVLVCLPECYPRTVFPV